MKKRMLPLYVAIPSLVILSGCDWLNKPKTTTEMSMEETQAAGGSAVSDKKLPDNVLLMIDGKPVLTVDEYEKYIEDVTKIHPQLKEALAAVPNARQGLCQTYQVEIIAEAWVKKQGIDKTPEYQEELRRNLKLFERQMALKYFQEEYPKRAKFDISDADALAWYNENKERGMFVTSMGGVIAEGIAFDKSDDAKAFLDKVKGNPGAFRSTADSMKLSVQDLRLMDGKAPQMDAAIVEKLNSVKQFPSVDLVKAGKKTWVVYAIKKEETTHKPYEELKEEIKKYLLSQDLFTKGIEQVKKELNVIQNNAYFEEKEKECEADLAMIRQEAEKADVVAQKDVARQQASF